MIELIIGSLISAALTNRVVKSLGVPKPNCPVCHGKGYIIAGYGKDCSYPRREPCGRCS